MDEPWEDGYDAGYEQGKRDCLLRVAEAFVCKIAGGWPDDDAETPKGWERWSLYLHGEEAGDTLDGDEGRAHFMKLFGYETLVKP